MKSKSSPILELTLAQLWRAVRDPATDSGVFKTLLTQTRSYLEQEEPESLESARRNTEFAHIISEMAERISDEGLMRSLLSELCRFKPQGIMLLASLFGTSKVAERQLKHAYNTLSPADCLAVVNRLLAKPRRLDSKLALWAAEEVHANQADDPEETLVFLEHLAKTGQSPSYPVQRELVHGRFGFWLQEIIGLDLDEEQALYMVETASQLRWRPLGRKLPLLLKSVKPAHMPRVFEAVGRTGVSGGDKTVKAALLFLKHKDSGTRVAAAGLLAALRSPKAVPALAHLCREESTMARAVGIALRLEAAEFVRFAKSLPASIRPKVLGAAVSVLGRSHPEAMARAVKSVAAGAKKADLAAAAKALAGYGGDRRIAPPKASFVPSPPRPYTRETDDAPSLLGKVKRLFGGGDEEQVGQGQAKLDAIVPGKKFSDATVRDAEAPGKNLSKTAFTKCTLRSLDLRQAAMGQAKFEGCKLIDLDMSSSRFKNVTFEGCDFTGVRFSGSAMEKVTFKNCTFKRVHFAAMGSTGLRTERCRFDTCLMWGMRAELWTARSCQFTLCDLSSASMAHADLDGVTFDDCLFLSTFADQTRIMNVRSRACVFHNCTFTRLTSDGPHFLAQAETTLQAQVSDAAARNKAPALPKALASEAGVRVMIQAAETVLFERDLARRRRLALHANRRRLDWCDAKLGQEAADVVAMLPGMLERPAVRNADGVIAAPACVIEGYTPDLEALELLDKHFEGAPAPDTKAPPPTIRVDAFYSIGSVGSIAQTKGSDIDMWVCFDESKVAKKDVDAFRKKLAAIEQWGDEEHGLELHFFVMDLDKVRENNFGFSDKESAGSSQALLLKEEFYRTAVLLAGKKLAWWLAPEGATGKAYKRTLARIAHTDAIPVNDTVDLGAMEGIPPGEFFGASLWQIVKALKSPFKSIMKFALLDAYLAGDGSDVLLCNRLKAGLMHGQRDFWSVDPYAVLYRDIEEHYARAGNAEARELLRMAFEQKTGFSAQGRTTGRPADMAGHSYLEHFFPYALDSQPGGATDQSKTEESATFAGVHDLGEKVSRFMFGTYKSIHEAASGQSGETLITGEDLTRLGRRIFGHFQAKPGKILHTPFVASPSSLFASLEIACEGIPGTPLTWVARGEHPKRGKAKSVYEDVRKERHPVPLLAWLWVNRVYAPGMQLMGKDLQAPTSVPDLRALAEAMSEHLDLHDIFEPEIEESLQEEEVTMAFLSVNFLADRDIKEYKDVVLIYATNWGELFCITAPKGLKYLEKDVREFLKANTNARIAADLKLHAHLPNRAQAPAPVLV